jgi:hypothetical protein
MVTPSGMTIEVKDVHPMNASEPNFVSVAGSVTSFKLTQYSKALYPISVNPEGSFTDSNDLQLAKQRGPITVTLSLIVSFVKVMAPKEFLVEISQLTISSPLPHSKKDSLPMVVTVAGIVNFFKFEQCAKALSMIVVILSAITYSSSPEGAYVYNALSITKALPSLVAKAPAKLLIATHPSNALLLSVFTL